MKFLLRNTVIYAFSLFLLPNVFSGLQVHGSLVIYAIGGLILTLMYLVLKPIINIISIPLNIATLGLFSLLVNLLILYLLTVFVPNITISPFTFQGFTFVGFTIPHLHLGVFGAYVIIAVGLAIISGTFRWSVQK